MKMLNNYNLRYKKMNQQLKVIMVGVFDHKYKGYNIPAQKLIAIKNKRMMKKRFTTLSSF